ncbi:replication initiator protein [Microviridae sp.]|nr:replication initiator protein [Microviridae sp.]
MLCKKPIQLSNPKGHYDVPCGQCLPCRINKGRQWTARLLMEAQCHNRSTFVTLTYDDGHLPLDTSVSKREIQLYNKKLRRSGLKYRYFAVGEYGSKKGRAHYHLAIFGADMYEIAGTNNLFPDPEGGFFTYEDASWKQGRVHFGELNTTTAGYICGYTTKKLTNTHDEVVQGRTPEFTLQSTKPPLGAPFIRSACEQVLRVAAYHDDPLLEAVKLFENRSIRINKKVWPLDRQMLKEVYSTLQPSADGEDQKTTRQILRTKIDWWTGKAEKKATDSVRIADKAERRIKRLSHRSPF